MRRQQRQVGGAWVGSRITKTDGDHCPPLQPRLQLPAQHLPPRSKRRPCGWLPCRLRCPALPCPAAHKAALPCSTGSSGWLLPPQLGAAPTIPPSRLPSAWPLASCCWPPTAWARRAAAAVPLVQLLPLARGPAVHAGTAAPAPPPPLAVQRSTWVTCQCMHWTRFCRWLPIRCPHGRRHPGRPLPPGWVRGVQRAVQPDHGTCISGRCICITRFVGCFALPLTHLSISSTDCCCLHRPLPSCTCPCTA